MMDRYRFEFEKDESGKYVDEYKNGNKISLIPDINNIEWVKYEDVKSLELQVAALTKQLGKTEQRKSKRFNINDCVEVKLTDLGKDIYYHQYDELNNQCGRKIIEPHYPVVDEGGYSKIKLWELMRIYGTRCSIGCDLPFETNITLCNC